MSVFSILETRELSGVTFVRDYLQLQFDGPWLNVYVWPRILTQSGAMEPETQSYRDALCALIGKSVEEAVEEPKTRLSVRFSDNSVLEISLRQGDRSTPEAAMLQEGTVGGHWTTF